MSDIDLLEDTVIQEIDGIEEEKGNENVKIETPFDPSRINTKIVPRNIGQLVELLEDNQIMIPKYQRLPNLWTEKKKSRFIESLMLDLPIPLFYFDEREDKKWYVVDGLQRMSTLEHFMIGKGEVGKNKGKLILQDLEFLTEYNGKTWDDLPRDLKRRINANQVTLTLILKGTPDEVKYTIFSRINQGDVPLKPQEIRTALFQGYRVDFLESLISEQTPEGSLFRKVTDGSVKSKRQEDLDFISRYIAFYLTDYSKYEPDLDRFITSCTEDIPQDVNKQNEIRKNYQKALNLALDVFGKDSFRKRRSRDDFRNQINKPMFEVIAVAFSKLNEEEVKKISAKKVLFYDQFIEFQKTNTKFWNAITTGTATKESVMNRNKEFNNFLINFLNDK